MHISSAVLFAFFVMPELRVTYKLLSLDSPALMIVVLTSMSLWMPKKLQKPLKK